MSDKICENCKHFRQHYGLNDHQLFRLDCGHCVHPRLQSKKPRTRACERFEPSPAAADNFVRKEYLSRRLLDYVLSLELLPEIRDKPGT